MNGRHDNGGSQAGRMLAILGGILVGGALGAAAMFLLAPRSGEQSRAQLQKQGEKIRKQAITTMDDVVAGAGDKANQFTDGVQRGVSDVQDHAHDVLAQAKKK